MNVKKVKMKKYRTHYIFLVKYKVKYRIHFFFVNIKWRKLIVHLIGSFLADCKINLNVELTVSLKMQYSRTA